MLISSGRMCAETGTRVSRARRARLAMTAWMDRTGIAVSRLLKNSAAGPAGAARMVEMLPDGAARGGVERDIARLESLALADTDTTGAVVHADVGDGQGRDLAHAQAGLQHDLQRDFLAKASGR